MGVCYCGNDAGWFRQTCKECKVKKKVKVGDKVVDLKQKFANKKFGASLPVGRVTDVHMSSFCCGSEYQEFPLFTVEFPDGSKVDYVEEKLEVVV
jgi:hypothetical protein